MKQLQLWKRMRGVLILGVAVPTAVVVAGVVVIIAVIIWYVVDYNLSPDSVGLSGSSIIPQGQSGRYTVTVKFAKPPKLLGTAAEILVMDDDSSGNDHLESVIVKAATSANGNLTLDCDANGLRGSKGSSDAEATYDVFAMYDRTWPMTNIESGVIFVQCPAE